jgi:hypothetical protein
MMREVKTNLLLAGSVAVVALALAPAAGAQPSTPGAPGYIPGPPDTEPGSFSYPYNVIPVGPPPATDARGTRISAGVDEDMKSAGLPGSSLGNSPQAAGPLVTSNSRYGISAGAEPPQSANSGIDARAGIAGELAGESPTGLPPQAPAPIESVQPDELSTPGGYPAPILETPGTIREGPAGVFVPVPQ